MSNWCASRVSVAQRPRVHGIAAPHLAVMACLAALIACEGATTPKPPTQAAVGTIVVSVAVSGNSNDVDGFLVHIAGKSLRVTRDAPVTIDSVAPQSYAAVLSDVADNCWSAGDTVTVTVAAGTRVNAQFDVQCYGGFEYQQADSGGNALHLYYVDESGRTAQLTTGPGFHTLEDFSPDGARFVYSGTPGGLLALASVTGSGSSTLTSPPTGVFGDSHARWSPDGQQIVYYRNPPGPVTSIPSVRLINSDGSGDHAIPLSGAYGEDFPSWSPDGSHLAMYTFRFDGWPEVGTMNVDGSDLRRLTLLSITQHFGLGVTSWSRDGTMIAFQTGFTLNIVPTAGGQWRTVSGMGSSQYSYCNDECDWDWSPDGQKFVITTLDYATLRVTVVSRDGTSPLLLGDGSSPSWSRDGAKILFDRVVATNDTLGRPPEQQIFIANPDGSGLHAVTRGAGKLRSAPHWNPKARPGGSH